MTDEPRSPRYSYMQEYRLKNKYKVNTYQREWRANNKGRFAKKQAVRRKAYPDEEKAIQHNMHVRLRNNAMNAYGGFICSWCGIDEPLVLTIDHIDNDGSAHRKRLSRSSRDTRTFLRWLRDNNYPPGFQVLCFNCNWAKHRNNGVLLKSLEGRCNDQGDSPYGQSAGSAWMLHCSI